MARERILVVDDEEDILELVRYNLEKEKFHVTCSTSGEEALQKLKKETFDLILLDLMLPGRDGLDTCRVLKSSQETSNIPVVMITAKAEDTDVVLGLELGADDYMVKPFDPKELVARVKAVLRRYEHKEADIQEIVYPNLLVNKSNYTVKVNGKELELPPKELELLFFLASNPNKVFTREQLLEHVWGFDFYGDSRTVDVHVKRVREKIETENQKWQLKTVWGVGYKFEVR